MHNARVETTTAPDGTPLVHARFDLSAEEVDATARAINAARTEQFRHAELSADDVLAMRELTALADELTSLAGHRSACTLDLRPERLVALRDGLDAFVAHRAGRAHVRRALGRVSSRARSAARAAAAPTAAGAGPTARRAGSSPPARRPGRRVRRRRARRARPSSRRARAARGCGRPRHRSRPAR